MLNLFQYRPLGSNYYLQFPLLGLGGLGILIRQHNYFIFI